ncbi:MAG: hypothetical protein LN413_00305 [Candidatus Thermoplasmatota archaeon]|nr:hypothetical protein [Candidatus Thermoplasmatota archaeon]
MAQLVLKDWNATDKDYVQTYNQNNDSIESAVNAHDALLQGTLGSSSKLLDRVFDRDGPADDSSYRLDLLNYAGGSQITIGRRPAPVAGHGEVDISFARGTFASGVEEVQLTGDVVLNAAAITSGLPKTIYIGIPLSGVPALFEDQLTGFVVYIYSMTWNAFSLTNFRRLRSILPGYETIKRIGGRPIRMPIFDPITDWLSDLTGQVPVFTLGAEDDNVIGFDEALEVIGFFVQPVGGEEGFHAPTGNPPDSLVKLRVESDGVVWSKADIEIDCGQAPDIIDVGVVTTDPPGDLRFVDIIRRFELKRVEAPGSAVVSAQNFLWGPIVRPLLGNSIPKDGTSVGLL